MGLQVYDERVPNNCQVYIDASVGTGPNPLVAAALAGTRVDHILLNSSAAADHDVRVEYYNGVYTLLYTASVPAGAGLSSTVPAVDLISQLPSNFDGLLLGMGTYLVLRMVVALTGNEEIWGLVIGGDF